MTATRCATSSGFLFLGLLEGGDVLVDGGRDRGDVGSAGGLRGVHVVGQLDDVGEVRAEGLSGDRRPYHGGQLTPPQSRDCGCRAALQRGVALAQVVDQLLGESGGLAGHDELTGGLERLLLPGAEQLDDLVLDVSVDGVARLSLVLLQEAFELRPDLGREVVGEDDAFVPLRADGDQFHPHLQVEEEVVDIFVPGHGDVGQLVQDLGAVRLIDVLELHGVRARSVAAAGRLGVAGVGHVSGRLVAVVAVTEVVLQSDLGPPRG